MDCMAAKRTGCLMLTGRSGRAGSSLPMLSLEAQPCLLTMARCDVGAGEELRLLTRFCPSTYLHAGEVHPPSLALSCVVEPPCPSEAEHLTSHPGGILNDAMLARQSAATLRTAMAPKVGGCAALEHRLHGCPLASSLLFSSLAALLGSAGQASYAAANAALDAEAAVHSASVSALSVLS